MIALTRIWIFVTLAIVGLGSQGVPQDTLLELSLDSSVPSVSPFVEDSIIDGAAPQEKTLTATPSQIVRAPLELPRVQRSIFELPGDRPSFTTASDKQPLRATLATNRTKLTNGDSLTELIVERYASGKSRLERWITEDTDGNLVNHGSYTEWDEKGNVLSTGNFVYGERDGFWSKTISAAEAEALAGQLVGFTAPFQSEATFQLGQIDGSWRVLDARGRTVLEWSFRKGKRDGRS